MRRGIASVVLVGALCIASVAAAETARDILDRAKQLNDTTRRWDDRHQRMKLVITGRGGERVRELELFERKEGAGEQKSIVFFSAPAEVKGTGFLAFTHRGAPADQWLYLPELQRVRQITARNRNESFVGTDLSYRDLDLLTDMPDWTDADAHATLRGEETVDGVPSYVIEQTPQRDDIGYKKVVVWLGKDDLVYRRIEFWEDDAAPTKRIGQRDIRNEGTIPVAHDVLVETPAKGTKTAITISDVQLNQKLADDLFTQRALERGGS